MRELQIIFGLIIILFGALLLLATNRVLAMTFTDITGIALILSALLFCIPGIALRRRAPGLTALFIPGALALAVGAILMYTGRVGFREWSYLWPILMIALGLAFFAMYYLGPRTRGLWLAGITVGGIGVFFFAIFASLFASGTAQHLIGPLALIALGLIFAFSALGPRAKRAGGQ